MLYLAAVLTNALQTATPVANPIVETSVLLKIFEKLPDVASIIVVVLIFIKFLTDDRKAGREFFKQLHDDHMEARKDSQARIGENTEALKENVIQTVRNTGMLADLSRIIERLDRRRD